MVKMNYPITEFNLEAPGGLIKVKAHCKNNQVESVTMESMPSFVGWTNKKVCIPKLLLMTISFIDAILIISGFLNEINTKIRFIICSYHNFILRKYDDNK